MAEHDENKWLWICQLGALLIIAIWIVLMVGDPDLLDALIARVHPNGAFP